MTVRTSESPLVLVADDEIPTTIMLQRIFEREGYQVECANDGLSALETAQRLLPDLILLDIQMPRMNGFDVLRQLRENASTAGIPTILITAKARQPSDIARGLNLGADDYMHKPFDPRELLARAESKIKARQLEETLHRRTQELEALLRVGEELNQYLEVSELLDLVLYLALDLLPGDAAVIYQLDEQRRIATTHFKNKGGIDSQNQLDNEEIVRKFLLHNNAVLWPGIGHSLVKDFVNGMAVPLQHGSNILGLLLILSHKIPYDKNHLQLFTGIGRQAALALRNAQLYEIQANYALHLEDMVAARTTELQSAQQMLIRSEKLASIGHLAASIAHEINNPLQPIRNILDDMFEDIQTEKPIEFQDIAILQESVERIRRIVSQLLEFTGKRSTDSDIQPLDISRVIEGIITLNRKFLEKEKVVVVADLPPLPTVYGSKDQLEQVFMNLTLNAQAAMDGGGELAISTHVEGNEVVVRFADTGCGIPREQIDKIFDPFYSTKPNGTGLGLFVSYGIIQNHHGTMEVESQVSVGTQFIIRLPTHAEK